MTGMLHQRTPFDPESFRMIQLHHGSLVGMLLVAALACGGCGYKGAIYSSYQEGGLGVRATAEGDAPVKVHFGYDRSVGAFVPRRGGNADAEEATALISKDQVGANINPVRMGTEDVLTVDSAFITGTAAIVASAPKDSLVIVKAPPTVGTDADGGANAATEAEGAAGQKSGAAAGEKAVEPPAAGEKATGRKRAAPGSMQFRTKGSAGERIGLALTQQPGRLSSVQSTFLDLGRKIGRGPEADKIYERAALKLPADFQKIYRARREKGQTPRIAFLTCKQDYLEGQPEDGARSQQINNAVRDALEGK